MRCSRSNGYYLRQYWVWKPGCKWYPYTAVLENIQILSFLFPVQTSPLNSTLFYLTMWHLHRDRGPSPLRLKKHLKLNRSKSKLLHRLPTLLSISVNVNYILLGSDQNLEVILNSSSFHSLQSICCKSYQLYMQNIPRIQPLLTTLSGSIQVHHL